MVLDVVNELVGFLCDNRRGSTLEKPGETRPKLLHLQQVKCK